MVSYEEVQESNSRIASELPARLVAVFAGGTSGLGEYTLKAFAKYVKQPRIYIIGRSQEAADRIVAECTKLNPKGEYIFMKADLLLIRNADKVCNEIMSKEKLINLLFTTQGTAYNPTLTEEGLLPAVALGYYSRFRFIANLLPLLEKATALRRVVSVFLGGMEGPVDLNDLALSKGFSKPIVMRGQVLSMTTLSMETLAAEHPSVAFVHTAPGAVRSGIFREKGWVNFALRQMANLAFALGRELVPEEAGERHLLYATSARYPAKAEVGERPTTVVRLGEGVTVAEGTDQMIGSGVYTPGPKGDSVASVKTQEVLANARKDGVSHKIWEYTESEFKRMTGSTAL